MVVLWTVRKSFSPSNKTFTEIPKRNRHDHKVNEPLVSLDFFKWRHSILAVCIVVLVRAQEQYDRLLLIPLFAVLHRRGTRSVASVIGTKKFLIRL